jgi:flavin-binding protein dodecin
MRRRRARRRRAGRVREGKESVMSVAKVVELTSSSTKSFEDAIASGITRAEKTLENVAGAWVSEQKVKVERGKITEWRVTMRVSFVLK